MKKRKRKEQVNSLEEATTKNYNLTLFSLPIGIRYQLIASYLTTSDLIAYAKTHTAALRYLLPELERRNRSMMVSTSDTHSLILYDGLLYGSGEGIESLFNPEEGEKATGYCGFRLIPTPAPVKQMVAGKGFTLILTAEHLVYVSGHYNQGYFTATHQKPLRFFQQITNIPGKVLRLAASTNHTLIQTEQGLFVWGNIAYGQSSSVTTSLVRLDNIPGTILQLAAADNYLLVLSSEGLFAWGSNDKGQLGLGDNQSRACFTQVMGIPSIIQHIAAGEGHSLLLADNKVYTTGDNCFGQLGLNDQTVRNCFTEVKVAIEGTIQQVLAGAEHSLILTESALYGCGYNAYTQLGSYLEEENEGEPCDDIDHFVKIKNLPTTFFQVHTGPCHLIVVATTGIYVCGENQKGQLGISCYASDMSIDEFKLFADLPKVIEDNLRFIQAAKTIMSTEIVQPSTLTHSLN